ncbi:MAG TPA: STAS domain-containing protein [Actinocrinis sp.]|nr:STAS domain-containing protein [Actinocrinis sp.]
MDAFLSVSDEYHPLITVLGETDLASAGDLLLRLKRLAGGATGQIELDLSQVTFMDCAGLRTLAEIDRHVSASGGSVRVAAVSPVVARLFELTGPHGLPLRRPPSPSLGIPTSGATDLPDVLAGDLPARPGALELAGSTGILFSVEQDRP